MALIGSYNYTSIPKIVGREVQNIPLADPLRIDFVRDTQGLVTAQFFHLLPNGTRGGYVDRLIGYFIDVTEIVKVGESRYTKSWNLSDLAPEEQDRLIRNLFNCKVAVYNDAYFNWDISGLCIQVN